MQPPKRNIEAIILAVAGALILILGLFPPWIIVTPSLRIGQSDVPERVKMIGHQFIFQPPDPADYRYAGDLINEMLPKPDGTPAKSPKRPFLDDNDATAHLVRMARIDLTRWSVEFITVVATAILVAIASKMRGSRTT